MSIPASRTSLGIALISLLPFANAAAQTSAADDAAKRFWDSALANCADSYYFDARPYSFVEDHVIFQFREPRFSVVSKPVSRKAKAVGIQWQGTIVMIAKSYRKGETAWGAFASGPSDFPASGSNIGLGPGWFAVSMEQTNGQWRYDWGQRSHGIEEIARLKLACPEIPGTQEFDLARKREQEEATRAAQLRAEAEQKRKQLADQFSAPKSELEHATQAAGFWVDPKTQITWSATPSRSCPDLRAGGFSDWRAATIFEVKQLFDPAQSHDYAAAGGVRQYHIAGGILLTSPVVWSSTSEATGSPPKRMLTFDFESGQRVRRDPLSGQPALCVRNSGAGKADDSEIGQVFRVGGGRTPPFIISKADPEYSQEARQAGYSGTVVLTLVVDMDGNPRNIKVLRGTGLGLDEKAIEAVEKWRFAPSTKDGAPVNIVATIEVNFAMAKPPKK